jgi:hypothetical protein
MRRRGSDSATTSPRNARRRACSITNGPFMKYSACCGTLVENRWALVVSGLAKSNVRNTPGRFWRSMKA